MPAARTVARARNAVNGSGFSFHQTEIKRQPAWLPSRHEGFRLVERKSVLLDGAEGRMLEAEVTLLAEYGDPSPFAEANDALQHDLDRVPP